MKILGFPILLVIVELKTVLSLRSRDGHSKERIQLYTNKHLAASARNLKSLKVDEISASLWDTYEKNLLNSAESRYVGNAEIHQAGDYIELEFRKLGLEIMINEFNSPVDVDSRKARNIVGRLVGTDKETILVGAHYDSLPRDGASPGADDNASGVATMLSIANALSRSKLKRNVVFVAFSGEEAGMLGSSHFADTLAPSLDIVDSIILDQNGNPGTSHSVIFESVGESDEKHRIIDTLADSVDSEKLSGGFVVNYNGFGSDHVPLSNAGIPSVLVIESENMEFARQYGHTDRDVLANVDPTFGSGIAQTVLTSVVRLAMA